MNEFTKSWIMSCLLYVVSILYSTLIFSDASLNMFPLFINILSLYTVLFIFHACCAIDNIPYKRFWDRYTLLLLTYGILFNTLYVEQIIIALPFYFYQLGLIALIIFTILRKWRFPVRIKALLALVFLGCSLFQMFYSYTVIFSKLTLSMLIINVCILLLLNFIFTYLYQNSLKVNQAIRDDYLYVLAEKAVDIIFYYTLNPYPRFSFISPSVESIVGYKQNDFYKNPMLHVELTHEQDREIINKAFSKDANSVNKNFIRWQRKDGEYIYLEFHNTPIFSSDKLIAIEGILRDITDRKMVEQEMLDSKKSKQILLSYISHELKTPITYIVGYTEALQNNLYESDKDKRNAIDLISSKALFLQRLVEDLFQLSKMESNQFSFEFMQTKVYALYEFLNEKHSNDILNTKIQYSTMIDKILKDEEFEVLVDIKRIQQVFANLLHNAIKHTPENGTIACKCILDEKNENVVFYIIDSGMGIPKEELPFIFKTFYRGKNAGAQSTEGSGLGLSLSRLIIQAHKGQIDVKSNKDKGSTFSFSIPLYKEEG